MTHMLSADVPFVKVETMYELTRNCLHGEIAAKLRGFARKRLHSNWEDQMLEHIDAWIQCGWIPNVNFKNQKPFEECSFRPDFSWVLSDLAVMLEVDEDAHVCYKKEQELERVKQLAAASLAKGHSTVFIRFNPSLPGSSTTFKYAKLLKVIVSVFARDKEYILFGDDGRKCAVVVHLFYKGQTGNQTITKVDM